MEREELMKEIIELIATSTDEEIIEALKQLSCMRKCI